MPAQPAAPRSRPATAQPVRKAAVTKTAAPKAAAQKVAVRTVPAQPVPRQIAYDQGYAGLGGPAPIIVQAKPSWARPGAVTAGAVLGFVLAGICVFAAIGWFTSASVANDVDNVFETGSFAAEANIRGALTLAIAAALVVGGIGAVSRASWGRWVLVGACAAEVLYDLQLVIVDGWFSNLVWVFVAVTAAALMLVPQAATYFATQDPMRANRA